MEWKYHHTTYLSSYKLYTFFLKKEKKNMQMVKN